MDFIIFYEHINRELESIFLVKNELEKKGYNVKISHFSGLSYGKNVLFSKPKVIVTPWLRTNENIYRFTRFRTKKHKLVNLQWEQIYSNKIINSGLSVTKDKALDATHLCWGENSKNRLIIQGVQSDNIVITGGVHMDFCRSEFIDYYKTREEISKEFKLNCDKQWILYISSFSYATYSEEGIKTLENTFNTSLSDIVYNARESKELTLEWIDSLLSINEELEFIYRPHPSENIDETLLSLEKKHLNFKIINEYSVKQWIKVSDKINTWFSTSVGEIFHMKKKCLIIRPIPIPDDIEVEIMKNATFIKDKKAFLRYNVDNFLDLEFPIKTSEINTFYDQHDTIPSYKRVANTLEEIYLNHESKKYEFSDKEEAYLRKKYSKQILISLIIELIVLFHIRLSKFSPVYSKTLVNFEKWIDHRLRFKTLEKQILSYMRTKI